MRCVVDERADTPERLRVGRRLDADDLSAVVGEVLRDGGADTNPGEIGDAEPGEWFRGCFGPGHRLHHHLQAQAPEFGLFDAKQPGEDLAVVFADMWGTAPLRPGRLPEFEGRARVDK